MKSNGLMLVFTGCSGVGKGTIVKELLKRNPNNELSVSVTTREPREGEVHGREYYFSSKSEFKELAANGGFLEYAEFCGNFYGTPKEPVLSAMENGRTVILEIEVQGGVQVINNFPDCVSVFVVPPSLEELERRLRGRGTEKEDVILERLAKAGEELKGVNLYDYRIVNDDLETAIAEVTDIIKTEREKRGLKA